MFGKFIVIEGLEGSGKTTVVAQVVKILKYHNITNIICTREPGSTPVSEVLRLLIKRGIDGSNFLITNYTELLMFYAARVQLVENVIKPALSRGIWVVGDRHDLSSQAYQVGGRGVDESLVKYLRSVFLQNFYPDLTFYLDIPPEVGLSRIQMRGSLDSIETESVDFFSRVRLAYQALANMDETIITINAVRALDQVSNDICRYLIQWLKIQKLK